eukprot:9703726-Prorocentrum_lima.AAC.1
MALMVSVLLPPPQGAWLLPDQGHGVCSAAFAPQHITAPNALRDGSAVVLLSLSWQDRARNLLQTP